MAVILGIILVLTVRPGADRDGKNTTESVHTNSSQLRTITTTDAMLDLIRNMVRIRNIDVGLVV